MDFTVSSPADLTTCAGCGTETAFAESFYVDGAGRLCTAPMPEWATGIEPPF